MDMFHESPMLSGVRQMLGAFARQMMRPIAIKHDQEESTPWDLMKAAQGVGMSQTAVLDGRKRLTGIDEDPDPTKPRSQARIGVVASEELAWGCAGIALALGGSNLAASPVARMGNDEQKQEFRRLLQGNDEHGHIKIAAMALSRRSRGPTATTGSSAAASSGSPTAARPRPTSCGRRPPPRPAAPASAASWSGATPPA
jgi:acyl-CoA dehydrogenase